MKDSQFCTKLEYLSGPDLLDRLFYKEDIDAEENKEEVDAEKWWKDEAAKITEEIKDLEAQIDILTFTIEETGTTKDFRNLKKVEKS